MGARTGISSLDYYLKISLRASVVTEGGISKVPVT